MPDAQVFSRVVSGGNIINGATYQVVSTDYVEMPNVNLNGVTMGAYPRQFIHSTGTAGTGSGDGFIVFRTLRADGTIEPNRSLVVVPSGYDTSSAYILPAWTLYPVQFSYWVDFYSSPVPKSVPAGTYYGAVVVDHAEDGVAPAYMTQRKLSTWVTFTVVNGQNSHVDIILPW